MSQTIEEIQTYEEELLNVLTHSVGLVLSIPAVWAMVRLAKLHGTKWHVWACSVYGMSLISMYLFSTIYHLSGVIPIEPYWQDFLRDLDHAAVYILIAGTYTPITLINLVYNNSFLKTIPKDIQQIALSIQKEESIFYRHSPTIGWITLISVWIMCVAGVWMKILIGTASIPLWISYGSHLGMGWLAILIIKPTIRFMPKSGLWYLLFGGVTYTIGVVFLLSDTMPFNHPVWHIFVGAASFMHYMMVISSSTVPVPPKLVSEKLFLNRWLMQLAASNEKMMLVSAKFS